MLKKRLLSSPLAFLNSITVHETHVARGAGALPASSIHKCEQCGQQITPSRRDAQKVWRGRPWSITLIYSAQQIQGLATMLRNQPAFGAVANDHPDPPGRHQELRLTGWKPPRAKSVSDLNDIPRDLNKSWLPQRPAAPARIREDGDHCDLERHTSWRRAF